MTIRRTKFKEKLPRAWPSPPFEEESIEKRISDLKIRQGILKEILELHTKRKIGADKGLWKGCEMKEAKDNEEEGKVIVTGFHGFEIEYNGIWVDVKYKGESLKGVIKASVAAFDPEDTEDIIPVLTL